MPRPTLKDIAERAGLSPMAVSRALRGTGRESAATCERVRAIAAELGYRPNGMARAMRRGTTGAVGLLRSTDSSVATMSHSFLWLIERELLAHDLHLVMGQVPDQKLTDRNELPRLLREWSVDGLLVSYTSHVPERMLDLLDDLHLPAVWLNAKLPANSVHPDDFDACHAATKRLLAMGHRRLAYLGAAPSPLMHYSVEDRLAGCRKAVGTADAVLTTCFWNKTSDCLGELTALLRTPQRPTALLTYSAYEATVALVAAARLGLDVPRDLSLVTVREESGLLGGVAVTTLQIPDHAMARASVDALLKRIATPTEDRPSVAVPLPVVTDGTCGPPCSPLPPTTQHPIPGVHP
jgi:DNA-binding LacI/PurR family transcriptional regulator